MESKKPHYPRDFELLPQDESKVNVTVNIWEDKIKEADLSDDDDVADGVHDNGIAGPLQKRRHSCEKIDIADDDGDDLEDDTDNCFTRGVERVQAAVYGFFNKYKRQLKIGIVVIVLILYAIYFCYALYYNFEEAVALLVITVFVVFCFAYAYMRDNFGSRIHSAICMPLTAFADKHWNVIRWVSGLVIVTLVIIWIIVDTSKNPSNMMSFVGLITIVVFCFVFSKHPSKVRWRPVIWGLILQIILALLILRTNWGFEAFRSLGNKVNTFINYVEAGSEFVFGELWHNHYFVFKVLPIMIFLSSVISCLYYVGLIQLIIGKLAWFLQFTMHTSASESLNAAGNVFLSMSESPLLVAPYIKTMTKSELHAVATGGYATIAGSIMGAAIAFGLSPSYLITASVMSAPAALAIAKLFYPETEKSRADDVRDVKINIGKYRNIIDALSGGAMSAIPLAVNIAANFIVFLAVLEFLNAMLSWAGGLVGYPDLSFELICAWVFMPLAYLMGVDWEDCFVVGELLGMKIVTSVTVSFKKLAIILENRELGLEPTISARSEVIVTYALCGFSHLCGIGITLGALLGIAPERRDDISSIVVRAMLAGNAANFLTACIAGILYEGDAVPTLVNATGFENATLGNLTLNNITESISLT
ncbi:solute carrier family 28 member 3-like [Ptychodera flava]|uniref:solute carrier family 28 member 3-like n=1 Tax=Ptychodera flava TaxID=63121 RepID=UPI00396A69CF